MVQNQNFFKTIFVWLFPAFLLSIVACKQDTPTPTGIVSALQQMQNLATTSYTLSKVIKANDNQTWYKIGDRKILITCEAEVKAGIDFSAIDTRYISKKGKSISLQLPPPRIISINLPPEKIQVAFQDIGFFRDQFSISEQSELLQQAEKQINAKAVSLGILEESKINARTWLTSYLSMLGFEEIDINFGVPVTLETR